ncbi:MAG: ester cyclase [Bacteroidota bacterium]
MKSNKEIVLSFFEASNKRDWRTIESLVHDDFIRNSSSEPREIKTNRGLITFHKQEAEVFPDLREEVVFAIEEGDLVAVRVHFLGTQRGPLGSFPASGKILDAHFNCFFKVTDGRIKESWVEYDNLNGLVQLGHYKME